MNIENPDALKNKHGGIFLVSNTEDQNAVFEGIAYADNKHLEKDLAAEQDIHAQEDLVLKDLDRDDKLTVTSLDLQSKLGNFPFDPNILLQAIIEATPSSKTDSGLSEDELIKKAKEEYNPTFLISLDKEDAEKYSNILEQALRSRHYEAYVVDASLGTGNIAEGLKRDKPKFSASLRRIYFNPDNKFQKFLNWISKKRNPALKTGFHKLDVALGGGLDNELMVIGAPSSIGKTTLALQIADELACQKKHVFYYALEMNSNQLISKSINRIAFQRSVIKGLDYDQFANKPNVRKIYQGDWANTFSKEIDNALKQAVGLYGELSAYIHIKDNMMKLPTASHIKEDVANFILRTGNKPIVIVDYLQLLQSEEGKENQTDKQRVSEAIWILKTISRDYQVPVIVISSFNRSSYNDPHADMSAFKESGDIDYSAECMITMSYNFDLTKIRNLSILPKDEREAYKEGTVSAWLKAHSGKNKNMTQNNQALKEAFDIARVQDEKAINIKIIKNRFGAITSPIAMYTRPQYDVFYEDKKNKQPVIESNIPYIKPTTKINEGQVIYREGNISLTESDIPF